MENKLKNLKGEFFTQLINDLREHGLTIELNELKQSKLKELRLLQDLVYADCSREQKTIEDVMECIDIMREAFNIQTVSQGVITKEDLNGSK